MSTVTIRPELWQPQDHLKYLKMHCFYGSHAWKYKRTAVGKSLLLLNLHNVICLLYDWALQTSFFVSLFQVSLVADFAAIHVNVSLIDYV